ncbi:MAG: alpha/beta fold hydrolase [Flavobacteriales bacterium]
MNYESSGVPLHFETNLTGSHHSPWILFIHGAGGSIRTWRKQVAAFEGKYNLLLIDLPGHAQSVRASATQEVYDFEWIGNKIWEVVDLNRIQTVHIVGVSLGSIIAAQMQYNRPHQVVSMIFSGPIVGLNLKLRLLARFSLALARVVGFQRFYAITARIALPRKNHQKSREIFVRESKAMTDHEYKKWTSMYGKTLDDTLNRLFDSAPQVPVLFVIGAQDHLFKSPALAYAGRFKQVHVVEVERCGHLVSLEKSERFNVVCLEFVQAHDPVA